MKTLVYREKYTLKAEACLQIKTGWPWKRTIFISTCNINFTAGSRSSSKSLEIHLPELQKCKWDHYFKLFFSLGIQSHFRTWTSSLQWTEARGLLVSKRHSAPNYYWAMWPGGDQTNLYWVSDCLTDSRLIALSTYMVISEHLISLNVTQVLRTWSAAIVFNDWTHWWPTTVL